MFHAAAIFAIATLAFGTQYASGATYTGCAPTFGIPAALPVLPAFTLATCLSQCQTLNFKYGAWLKSSAACYCGNTGPWASTLAVSSSIGSCDSYFNAVTYNIFTSFQNTRCTTGWTRDSRDSAAPSNFAVQDAQTCYNSCARYQYAFLNPNAGNNIDWLCSCGNYPLKSPVSSTCSKSTVMEFQHTVAQASAGVARKRMLTAREEQLAMLAANPHCPPGATPCQVSPDSDHGYECLRTDSELESCGGCKFGVYGLPVNASLVPAGLDCTGIAGVNPHGVTCSDGQCVVSLCKKGYRLASGECI